MEHRSKSNPNLQPLLFTPEDFANCFFRKPSDKEYEFLTYLTVCRRLLTAEDLAKLDAVNELGRTGYKLMSIFALLSLKLLYSQVTMKQTLELVRGNDNLRQIVGVVKVPSEATVSRLSGPTQAIANVEVMQERVMALYSKIKGGMVGHLSVDSTTNEAREKPIKGKRAVASERKPKKRGRKKKGSPEEAEYLAAKALEEEMRARYLAESPEELISRLEKRCSLTAKTNSKGKKQWFVGYKTHIACDDFGVPLAFVVTGACVHDSRVAVPLMKLVRMNFVFLYALMDKGYVSPDIEEYIRMVGAKAIIDRPAYNGVSIPMDPATAQRYKARTTVERTNSELKDGFLPVKLYRRGANARYDISLGVLLTTIKKVLAVVAMMQEQQQAA